MVIQVWPFSTICSGFGVWPLRTSSSSSSLIEHALSYNQGLLGHFGELLANHVHHHPIYYSSAQGVQTASSPPPPPPPRRPVTYELFFVVEQEEEEEHAQEQQTKRSDDDDGGDRGEQNRTEKEELANLFFGSYGRAHLAADSYMDEWKSRFHLDKILRLLLLAQWLARWLGLWRDRATSCGRRSGVRQSGHWNSGKEWDGGWWRTFGSMAMAGLDTFFVEYMDEARRMVEPFVSVSVCGLCRRRRLGRLGHPHYNRLGLFRLVLVCPKYILLTHSRTQIQNKFCIRKNNRKSH